MKRLNDSQITLIRRQALLTHIADWVGSADALYEDISRVGVSYVGKVWDEYECVPRTSHPVDFMTLGVQITTTATDLETMYLELRRAK